MDIQLAAFINYEHESSGNSLGKHKLAYCWQFIKLVQQKDEEWANSEQKKEKKMD